MKSMETWHADRRNLSDYLQVGDEVDESIVEYMYNVLPPVTMNGLMVQMGEPHDHNEQGKALFITVEKKNGSWIYTGIKTKGGK